MNTLRPAEDGTLVPASARVFRIGKNSHLSLAALRRGKASPAMFELSSEDKAALGQRLSIWVEELTVADQAWTFMGANPERTIVACLNVAAIHAIPAEPGFDSLRVEWEQALIDGGNGYKVPNTKPGAEGHAGIAGLNQGGNGITHRNQRKSLREALAEITTISPVPVPHDIPEEHLSVAAFYISLDPVRATGSDSRNWIEAIRQLRRERVRQEERTKLAGEEDL